MDAKRKGEVKRCKGVWVIKEKFEQITPPFLCDRLTLSGPPIQSKKEGF
jgi:hypothetical protein